MRENPVISHTRQLGWRTRDGIPRFANLIPQSSPRSYSPAFGGIPVIRRDEICPEMAQLLRFKGPFTAVDGRNPAITTCDVEHPVNNEIFTIATGEFTGFLNHQQCHLTRPL